MILFYVIFVEFPFYSLLTIQVWDSRMRSFFAQFINIYNYSFFLIFKVVF